MTTRLTKKELSEINLIEGIKQRYNICTTSGNSNKVEHRKILVERLDEELMEVYVIYNKRKFMSQGNIAFSFIVVDKDDLLPNI